MIGKWITVFLVVALVLLSGSRVFSQVTSKKEAYSSRKTSSEQEIVDLLKKADGLKITAPQEALELVKEALALSISQRNLVAEGSCYNLLGEINLQIDEWKLALENFTTAYEKLSVNEKKGRNELLKCLHGLGESSLKLQMHDQALKYFVRFKALANTSQKAEADIFISEVYFQMGKFADALRVIESIVPPKVVDANFESRIADQKAKIYARTNQLEKANENLRSSQNLSRAASKLKTESPAKTEVTQSAKEEISDVLVEQKKYDQEIELRNNSIDFNIEQKNPGEVSKDKVELSKALVMKGEPYAAIRELEEAAFIADTIGDPNKQAVAYLALAELYDQNSNPAGAITTYKKYSQAVERLQKQDQKLLLEKSTLIKTQRDIEELAKYVEVSKQEEQLAQAVVFRQKLIIYGLLLIIVIVAVTSYFIYKNAVASKTANQLLALKSLRSQMNPHFIFNALNSVNHFVAQNDERTANKFLSEFSRLMRLVLENSQEDFIPLFKEEEIISLYLKLEHYRFRDKFDYAIEFDDAINKESVEIPPMLLQPYIENAVWHGLRYKDSKGFLLVKSTLENNELVVEISDNGIGRKRSVELKTANQMKHNSTGLKNIEERLTIINEVYRSDYRVKIEDATGNSGTVVRVYIPVNTKSMANA
jgi:hypothetical protein